MLECFVAIRIRAFNFLFLSELLVLDLEVEIFFELLKLFARLDGFGLNFTSNIA